MTYTGVGETQRVGAGTKTYQYDATGLANQTDGSTSTYFTSLPDGTVISESVSGSTYYYLSDGAGSVAGLMDLAGALKNQYSYDPLGSITSSSGTVSNPFTFQGGVYDSQTGFYNTGSGYYDPATGRTFGCQDKGWWDPGEDLCGEDENTSGSLSPQIARRNSRFHCSLAESNIDVVAQFSGGYWYLESLGVKDVSCNKGFNEATVTVVLEQNTGEGWQKVSGTTIRCPITVPVNGGETFSCVEETLRQLSPGTYRLKWSVYGRYGRRNTGIRLYGNKSCEFMLRANGTSDLEPPC
jgi:RHS repeat-associated protein